MHQSTYVCFCINITQSYSGVVVHTAIVYNKSVAGMQYFHDLQTTANDVKKAEMN